MESWPLVFTCGTDVPGVATKGGAELVVLVPVMALDVVARPVDTKAHAQKAAVTLPDPDVPAGDPLAPSAGAEVLATGEDTSTDPPVVDAEYVEYVEDPLAMPVDWMHVPSTPAACSADSIMDTAAAPPEHTPAYTVPCCHGSFSVQEMMIQPLGHAAHENSPEHVLLGEYCGAAARPAAASSESPSRPRHMQHCCCGGVVPTIKALPLVDGWASPLNLIELGEALAALCLSAVVDPAKDATLVVDAWIPGDAPAEAAAVTPAL